MCSCWVKLAMFCLVTIGRMDVVLDGIVLRGQAKGIKADGKEHVVALHPLLPADDVHGGEGPGVSHMRAPGRRDRGTQSGRKNFSRVLSPVTAAKGFSSSHSLLPLLFNGRKIVLHDALLY